MSKRTFLTDDFDKVCLIISEMVYLFVEEVKIEN